MKRASDILLLLTPGRRVEQAPRAAAGAGKPSRAMSRHPLRAAFVRNRRCVGAARRIVIDHRPRFVEPAQAATHVLGALRQELEVEREIFDFAIGGCSCALINPGMTK